MYMKVLVLSDSHGSFAFMRDCIQAIKPAVIVHLGDHFSDAETLRSEYPNIPFYCVPGNCDRVFATACAPEVICCDIGGVRVFMTHGHCFAVKSSTLRLRAEARKAGAQIALYGHTHDAECVMDEGLLILNPGSCRGYGRSAGLLEIEDKRISSSRILRQEDIDGILTLNSRE